MALPSMSAEITPPEYYPLFSIIDKSLLPPEVANEIHLQIEDEDIVIISREQIEDGAAKDKKKRPADPKAKGSAAAANTSSSKKVL